MENNFYKTIKYSKGFQPDSEGINLPQFGQKKIMTSSVRRYNNSIFKVAKLDKCTNLFLNYLTEEMDSINSVHLTDFIRSKFIDFVKKNCGEVYADSTIKQAITSLKKNGLLIHYGVRVDYTVNPLYFFKGEEKEREKLIKELLYEYSINPTKGNLKFALGM